MVQNAAKRPGLKQAGLESCLWGVIKCVTESDAAAEWTAMLHRVPAADLSYLMDHFYALRQRFWYCYTKSHTNFGARSTQLVESFHSVLKGTVQTATSLTGLSNAIMDITTSDRKVRIQAHERRAAARDHRNQQQQLQGLVVRTDVLLLLSLSLSLSAPCPPRPHPVI